MNSYSFSNLVVLSSSLSISLFPNPLISSTTPPRCIFKYFGYLPPTKFPICPTLLGFGSVTGDVAKDDSGEIVCDSPGNWGISGCVSNDCCDCEGCS